MVAIADNSRTSFVRTSDCIERFSRSTFYIYIILKCYARCALRINAMHFALKNWDAVDVKTVDYE
jgi:hypothetical protein